MIGPDALGLDPGGTSDQLGTSKIARFQWPSSREVVGSRPTMTGSQYGATGFAVLLVHHGTLGHGEMVHAMMAALHHDAHETQRANFLRRTRTGGGYREDDAIR
jgi:hypothetical protein